MCMFRQGVWGKGFVYFALSCCFLAFFCLFFVEWLLLASCKERGGRLPGLYIYSLPGGHNRLFLVGAASSTPTFGKLKIYKSLVKLQHSSML